VGAVIWHAFCSLWASLRLCVSLATARFPRRSHEKGLDPTVPSLTLNACACRQFGGSPEEGAELRSSSRRRRSWRIDGFGGWKRGGPEGRFLAGGERGSQEGEGSRIAKSACLVLCHNLFFELPPLWCDAPRR